MINTVAILTFGSRRCQHQTICRQSGQTGPAQQLIIILAPAPMQRWQNNHIKFQPLGFVNGHDVDTRHIVIPAMNFCIQAAELLFKPGQIFQITSYLQFIKAREI